jgi:insulysin
MIFMGSEKYPNENAFFELMAASGGYSNAYTSSEVTNY